MSILKNSPLRLVLFLLGFLGAFLTPWLTLVCAVILVLLFPAIEVLALGLLVDFLWLPAAPLHIPLATLAAIIVLWAFDPLRRDFLLS